jgi:ABC-type amino acid transport substrate-binding protein
MRLPTVSVLDPGPCRRFAWLSVAVLVAALTGGPRAWGQVEPSSEGGGETLTVGVREAPPFVMRDREGRWSGITVELWRTVAEDLGLKYRYRPVKLEEMLSGLESGKLDVGIGALSVTSEREERFDFSHPFFEAGLGIAVAVHRRAAWRRVLSGLFSAESFSAFGLVFVGLLAIGSLIWLAERRRNEQFSGRPARGLGAGMWWAAVTMTTVGYGDKAPVTVLGRALGIVWMLASLFFVAAFTAAITASLTVSQLDGTVRGVADLYGLRVGTVSGSTALEYLMAADIHPRGFPDALAGIAAVAGGKLDAFVYDRPLLRYLVGRDRGLAARTMILPNSFDEQRYALGLRSRSPLREPVNRAVLATLESRRWADILSKYMH